MKPSTLANSKFLIFYPFHCRDLKQQLTADVMELIKQQRLNFMVKGGKLSNRSMKGKRMIILSR